ncbi:hypothetical protein ACP4OV_003756 [Aristida adscensionis]
MASPFSSWPDLHDDTLHEVVRRLPCRPDRDRMAEVCGPWHLALARLPAPPPQLPWLLLPSDGVEPTRVACVIDGCVVRHRFTAAHAARLLGSYSGGWLFVALEQTRGHALVHLRTRDPQRSVRPIPDMLSRPGGQHPEKLVILAATLSSPPDRGDCIGAAIVATWDFTSGPRQVVFWRMGDVVAVDAMLLAQGDPRLEAEDVVYFKGAFHFLTVGEHLRVCDPVDVEVERAKVKLDADHVCWFQPRPRVHSEGEGDLLESARYLVESRNCLMMVVRLRRRYPDPKFPTVGFKIYEVNRAEVTTDDGTKVLEYSWSELPSLDDRVIFVGRGCSKSYEVSEFVEAGIRAGVYFIDDEGYFKDVSLLFEEQVYRLYPGSDNGKWSAGGIDHCFTAESCSNRSPPGWLLP